MVLNYSRVNKIPPYSYDLMIVSFDLSSNEYLIRNSGTQENNSIKNLNIRYMADIQVATRIYKSFIDFTALVTFIISWIE